MQLRPALVGTGQRQQRVQELRHPIHLLECLLERGERLRRHLGPCDGALDARADNGEWRLQLVARVGGEPPQRREAAFQARHHLIQRLGQSAQLVALHRDGEPPVQRPAVGNLANLGDHPIHRLERAPGNPAADEDGRDDADDERNEDRGDELLEPQLRGLRVRAGEDRAKLLAGIRHGAHDVMQGRPIRFDPKTPRQVRHRSRGRGRRGARDRVQGDVARDVDSAGRSRARPRAPRRRPASAPAGPRCPSPRARRAHDSSRPECRPSGPLLTGCGDRDPDRWRCGGRNKGQPQRPRY